jgi:ribonuclease G
MRDYFPRVRVQRASIDQQIAAALRKTVDLPSGGNVVIEQTESMVTIDVNTGSYLGSRDQAATILTTNIEAAGRGRPAAAAT